MIKVTDNKEVKETVLAGLAIANFMLKLKTNNYG